MDKEREYQRDRGMAMYACLIISSDYLYVSVVCMIGRYPGAGGESYVDVSALSLVCLHMNMYMKPSSTCT